MVIGIKKKKRNEVSNRNLGAGEMVQNADSGIVWKERILHSNLGIRNGIEKSLKITKNVSFLDFRAKIALLSEMAKLDFFYLFNLHFWRKILISTLNFRAKRLIIFNYFYWFCRIYETILEDFHTLWKTLFNNVLCARYIITSAPNNLKAKKWNFFLQVSHYTMVKNS